VTQSHGSVEASAKTDSRVAKEDARITAPVRLLEALFFGNEESAFFVCEEAPLPNSKRVTPLE